MDIQRPSNARAKKIKRIVYVTVAVLACAGITLALSKLKPAAPSVDASTIWPDTVKRGPMLREVRGLGTLVPEDIHWIPAQTAARVDKIVIRPGHLVQPDTVILEMSNPETQRDLLDAEYALKAAEANYANLRVQVDSDLMSQKANEAAVRSDYEQAHLQHDVDEKLFKEGIGSENTKNLSKVKEDQLAIRLQLESQQTKIAETQAKDIVIGQKATIDTRNGVVTGHVSRQDPSVVNGTVTVDVAFDEPLPPSARADLSVDGTIELENLKDVMYVGRPVHGQADSTISLFKITPDGSEASRVNVKLGRSSVTTIEILSGLQVGDKVILSDMSQWDNVDRIRLK